MSLFTPQPLTRQPLYLAKHLPDGKLWENKFNISSNIGKLIKALSSGFHYIQEYIHTFYTEFGITTTDQLIEDWEKSVGIPGDCFTASGTLAQRRIAVEQKFSNYQGVQVASDFVRVAALFGFDIDVFPGAEKLTGTDKTIRHTIVVVLNNPATGSEFFPLGFPVVFSSQGQTTLQCVFDTLAPANVKVEIYKLGDI